MNDGFGYPASILIFFKYDERTHINLPFPEIWISIFCLRFLGCWQLGCFLFRFRLFEKLRGVLHNLLCLAVGQKEGIVILGGNCRMVFRILMKFGKDVQPVILAPL